MVQQFQRYLPTAFDEGMTLLEKVNKIIIGLNQIGKLSNDVLDQWNQVMDWVMSDGLDASINEKIDSMLTDGTLATVINETLFNDLSARQDADEKSLNELNIRLDADEKSWTDFINTLSATFGVLTDLKQPNGTTITTKIQNEFTDYGTNILWYSHLVTDQNDWSPAFQQAINDVAAAGGGVVIVPPQTFRIKKTITLKQWVKLEGVSNTQSVIKCAEGVTLGYLIDNEIIAQNYTPGIQVKNLALDGSRGSGVTGGLIAYNTWQGEFANLRIYNCHGDALVIYGKSSNPAYGASTNWVKDCYITYNDGFGVRVDVDVDYNGNPTALNGDVQISGCDIGMHGLSGIFFNKVGASSIRNCVVWMNGQAKDNIHMSGIHLSKGSDLVEITACNIEGNQAHGVYIDSNYTTVNACRIFTNSQNQAYNFFGVFVHDGTGNIITSNKWNGQQRGVYNNGTYTVVRDNDFRWNNAQYSPDTDYDFVESTPVAGTSLNFDFAHIMCNINNSLTHDITLATGSNNIVFDTSSNNSWAEYSNSDGYFRPVYGGWYVFEVVLNIKMANNSNITFNVNGTTYYTGNITSPNQSGATQTVTFTTQPIQIPLRGSVNLVVASGAGGEVIDASSFMNIRKWSN
jgi:hypothetical protein